MTDKSYNALLDQLDKWCKKLNTIALDICEDSTNARVDHQAALISKVTSEMGRELVKAGRDSQPEPNVAGHGTGRPGEN